MENVSVGFVGAGRVTSIILGGWSRADAMPGRIRVYDSEPEAAQNLQGTYNAVEAVSSVTDVAKEDVVILAVPPPAVGEIVGQIGGELHPEGTLVSLAPKITSQKISQMLNGFSRIVRMIPNAASIVGSGYNPIAFSESMDADERERCKRLFRPLGEVPDVREDQLDAYAVITAMGPTYLWPQLYELESLAESFGLSPEAAMEGVQKMVHGTVNTMKDSGLSAEEVQNLIPAYPMGEETSSIVQAYRKKLNELYEKMSP